MKKIALGSALALAVCLATPVLAETYGDTPAPAASEPQTEAKIPALPLSPRQNKSSVGTETPKFGALAQKTFFSLAALSMLFLLATGTYKRFAQKRGTTQSSDSIEILARKPLGPRQALMVVGIGGQKFFVSQAAEGVRLISELETGTGLADLLAEEIELLEERKRVTR